MTKTTSDKTLTIFASLIVIIAGLKAAGDLLTPIMVSLFFAVLCVPPLERLKKYGVPEGIAIAIVVAGAILALTLMTAIISGSLSGFDENIPAYTKALDTHTSSLFAWLTSMGVDMTTEKLRASVSSGAVFGFVKGIASQLLNTLSGVFLVILTMIFMLTEASSVPRKLRVALGKPNSSLQGWGTAMEQVQKYVAIKAIVSLITAILATVLTAVLGIDFPLLWGLMAFLFNFIPNIGSVLAAVPPMLLGLVQYGTGTALAVGVGYFALNMVMGNIVEPKMMGRRLGLSTLVVFLSLVFWNWVWGPVGMVLSVPLTVIVKIILEHSTEFRGLAIMLGADTEAQEGNENVRS